MPGEATDVHPIRSDADIVLVRQIVRAKAVEVGMSLVDQTKIVTAASELARNALEYGGGGTLAVSVVREPRRSGVRLVFEDEGPGIPDVAKALGDRYTTGRGLGLGLGGARRLSSEFAIVSSPAGTRVTIARWTAR